MTVRLDIFLGGDLGLRLVREVLKPRIRQFDFDVGSNSLGYIEFGVIGTTDTDILAALDGAGLIVTHLDVNAWATQVAQGKRGVVGPAVALLVHHPTIVRAPTIATYRRIYNLHPGLLPHGRGMFPVPWAIIDGVPAGATLHVIDSEKVDAGPIVYTSAIAPGVRDYDTAEDVHQRVRAVEWNLLKRFIDHLRYTSDLPRETPIDPGTLGPNRKRADFDVRRHIDAAEIDRLSARDLLRLVRAYTFTGYPGLRVGDFELTLKKVGL